MNPNGLLYFLASSVAFGRCTGWQNFKLELVTSVFSPEEGWPVDIEGPTLEDDPQKQTELCVAAKNFISARSKGPEGLFTARSGPGGPQYPDKSSPERWMHVKRCGTIPEIWLRAGQSSGEYVIMVDLNDIAKSSDKQYTRAAYTYNLEIFATDPAKSSRTDAWRRKALAQRGRLESLFRLTMMSFLDLLYICAKAKQHLAERFVKKPVSFARSDVGPSPLKLYNYASGQLEEYLAFKCPVEPVMYVYFAGPQPDVRVEIVMVRWGESVAR